MLTTYMRRIRNNNLGLGLRAPLCCLQLDNVIRAQNNGRSTDNVRPDRGVDRSNSRLAGHSDRSFLDACRLIVAGFFSFFCSFALNPLKKNILLCCDQ